MAATQSSGKVLRACVVHASKVLDEQRLDRKQSLSIGTSAKNTFVVPVADLPPSYTLIQAKGNGYELVVTEHMDGRLASVEGQEAVDFADLKQSGVLKKRGNDYFVPLTDAHRGKVVIGDLTVIFQFVVPPPKVAVAALPEATKVSWKDRIDLPLAMCLLGVVIVEAPLVAVIYNTPPAEEITLETLDDKWVQLIAPEKKPEPAKAQEEKKAATAEKAETKKKKATNDNADDASKAKAKAAKSAEIRKSIASKGVLAIIGSAGDGGGAVADVFGSGGIGGDLDSAFDGISGVGLATGNGRTTRGGGDGAAASIGGLATSGGGAVGLGGKKEARVGSVKTEAPEVDGSLDSGAIAKVVSSRMRMVQDCYERELKRDPNLSGKIEIEFTIGEDGRVEEAKVSSNKMGSDAVGQCIVGRIRSWRFPKPDGGSVTVNFPFIFAASS